MVLVPVKQKACNTGISWKEAKYDIDNGYYDGLIGTWKCFSESELHLPLPVYFKI